MPNNSVNKPIHCRNCPYYTGVTTQGHGDYWGSCTWLDVLKRTLANTFHKSTYDFDLKKYDSSWFEALFPESECLFLTLEVRE